LPGIFRKNVGDAISSASWPGDDFAKPTLAEQESSALQNKAAKSILAAKALERRSISVKKFLELVPVSSRRVGW